MFVWKIIHILVAILLVFHCSSLAVARLNKRNGYPHYKPSSHYFEHAHEPATAPSASSHESSNSKYELVYYDYKNPTATHSGGGGGGGGRGKQGYSIGSGLRSIAQGSANQAYTAVANQHAAAKQAAFIAKNTLAHTASQAAATAQAALAGKQVLLQELEQQANEAKHSLSRELEQLQTAKTASNMAQETAQAAFNHVSVLTAAVNNAKSVAEHAEQTANEVSNQLASQSAMVGQAKTRIEQVEQQLKQAQIDFEATKDATLKASSSAAEAQVNASKAGAHATVGLHDATNQHSSSVDSDGSIEESYDEHIDTTATGDDDISVHHQ